ncbi:MAG: magnesium chelatase [Acidobacteria bacterium]|nr:magnesium chelatase [Acidobacteriota bacterium]
MLLPSTLKELKSSEYSEAKYRNRTVKTEMRETLIRKIKNGETLFPGVMGYEDSVIPQVINAILSRHNFILLGLRGQAKSRLLRSLTSLLDEHLPIVAGCEINDNPYAPLCRACHNQINELGDNTPINFIPSDRRYVEKLATPDVTIADIIGDVDPIKAARSGYLLSDELTIHYGLLPRANRGIFAINELPDLAGKIQVGLFNIMQEGDIQIKGYPIRLPLDVAMVFSANPEDYTARGKIITPLKDRIGAEIHTHYPKTVEDGISITRQEAWINRFPKNTLEIPPYILEIIEHIAFVARQDSRIDKRSGVSQRLPISTLESVISNAERRMLFNSSSLIVPRISDIYASLPTITGKLELEYEGEQLGADRIAYDLIKRAVGQTFMRYFNNSAIAPIVDWFNLGGTLQSSDTIKDDDYLVTLKAINGLFHLIKNNRALNTSQSGLLISACEFFLEGLYAQKKISRSEHNIYSAAKVERSQSRFVADWSDLDGVN